MSPTYGTSLIQTARMLKIMHIEGSKFTPFLPFILFIFRNEKNRALRLEIARLFWKFLQLDTVKRHLPMAFRIKIRKNIKKKNFWIHTQIYSNNFNSCHSLLVITFKNRQLIVRYHVFINICIIKDKHVRA